MKLFLAALALLALVSVAQAWIAQGQPGVGTCGPYQINGTPPYEIHGTPPYHRC